jgi:hypothetical protein
MGPAAPGPNHAGANYLQPQGDSQHRRREQSRSHRLGRQVFSQVLQLEQELVQVEQPLLQLEQVLLPQLLQLVPQPLLQLVQPLPHLLPQPHGSTSTGTRRTRLTQISSGTVTLTRLQTVVGTHSVVVTGTFTWTVYGTCLQTW